MLDLEIAFLQEQQKAPEGPDTPVKPACTGNIQLSEAAAEEEAKA